MNENYIDEKNKNLELPIEKIIGDPFYAAIDTQSKMGKLSLEFINQLGFDSDSNQISYLEFSSCIPEISENNSIIELSPSSLDFQVSKCHRCFFLYKKLGIQTNNYPPPVFSKLDIVQKKLF